MFSNFSNQNLASNLTNPLTNSQKTSTQTAFKEWAIVVDALSNGHQILILRKGGLREGKAGFRMAAKDFWLFPTWFHQQGESVIEAAQKRFEKIHQSNAKRVQIGCFAKVHWAGEIDSWERIFKIRNQHIWRESVIRERFEWGKKKAIFAIAVRIYRLPSPVEIPLLNAYEGCRSWVQIIPNIAHKGLVPVLDDASFTRRFDAFQNAIL